MPQGLFEVNINNEAYAYMSTYTLAVKLVHTTIGSNISPGISVLKDSLRRETFVSRKGDRYRVKQV